jgi:hypothetical protein
VSARALLLDLHETLTPADHQTHRRFLFQVPPDAGQLAIWVRYAPKRLEKQESVALAEAALAQQTAVLASGVGENLAEQWSADHSAVARSARIVNLLTISLDDAHGVYRGANHRHGDDQHLELGAQLASPGLVVGKLPPGEWTLTVSAHTVASDQCELSIQIEAEIAAGGR